MSNSLFGFDLFDSILTKGFTSPGEDQENVRQHRDFESASDHHSLPNSVEEALTLLPPAWIEVRNQPADPIVDDESTSEADAVSSNEDDLACGGITILSSVPSSINSSQLDNSAVSVLESAFSPPLLIRTAEQASLSISTTQTQYADGYLVPLSSSSHLSVNLSSLCSTIEDLSLLDGTPHAVSSGSCESCASTASIEIAEDLDARPPSQSESSVQDARILTAVSPPSSMPTVRWFSHLKTEDDWLNFQEETLNILHALSVDNDGVADDDRLLASLIQQEEHMFWRSQEEKLLQQRQRYLQKSLVLLSNTAVLVAAPVIAFTYWKALRSTQK